MNPFICGGWDGGHVWLQWDASEAPHGYDVQLRFKFQSVPPQDWTEWHPPVHSPRAWLPIAPNVPTGTLVQGRVSRSDGRGRVSKEQVDSREWFGAMEAMFVRSRCKFEFSSQLKTLHFSDGTLIHSVVDGAACSYRLPHPIEFEPGKPVTAELEAVTSTGYAQLDNENDFYLRPQLGVVIRNIEPSNNDIQETGCDYTELKAVPRDGPITLAFLRPELVR